MIRCAPGAPRPETSCVLSSFPGAKALGELFDAAYGMPLLAKRIILTIVLVAFMLWAMLSQAVRSVAADFPVMPWVIAVVSLGFLVIN